MRWFARLVRWRRPVPVALILVANHPEVRRWWFYGKVMKLLDLPYTPSLWSVNETGDWSREGYHAAQMNAARAHYAEITPALAKAKALVADLEADTAALLAAFPGCDKTFAAQLVNIKAAAKETIK